MRQSTITNQRQNVNNALPFIGVVKRDNQDRPTLLSVPGSEGKSYHVIIKRDKGLITLECNLDCGNGYQACKGNNKTICKHVRAAVNWLMVNNNYKVRWFDSYEKAYRMLMGGKIIVIQSKQSNDIAWIVINK